MGTSSTATLNHVAYWLRRNRSRRGKLDRFLFSYNRVDWTAERHVSPKKERPPLGAT
jgi:hypothetical protein